jgi:hypothetical protein
VKGLPSLEKRLREIRHKIQATNNSSEKHFKRQNPHVMYQQLVTAS